MVSILAYDHTPVSFEAGLRYKIEKKLTITGFLMTENNPIGTAPLLNKEAQALLSAVDYVPIYLNGILFGNGKITNIRFTGGDLVRSEKVTYEIICYEAGNLFNATNGVYLGINWSTAALIDTLQENFSYSLDDSQTQHYKHDVSVRYINNNNSVIGSINLAQALANNLFNSTTGIGAFIAAMPNFVGIKRYYTESYNLVNNSCAFSESAEIPATLEGNYSLTLKYDLKLDTEGFVTVSEVGHIVGLIDPILVAAETAYTALKAGAYARVQAIYNDYAFSAASLFDTPIQVGLTKNKFEAILDFTFVFTNNPKYNETAIWEYTDEVSRDSNGVYEVRETGTVTGFGRPRIDKYPNALAFYNASVIGGITGRLLAAYDNTAPVPRSLVTIQNTYEEEQYLGKITYTVRQTDNNLYSAGGIRKSEIKVVTSYPVQTVQAYNVVNAKEALQPQQTSTEGVITIDIQIQGVRTLQVQDYLAYASTFILAYDGIGNDNYLKGLQYHMTPNTNTFAITATYRFSGMYKEFGDLSLT